MLAPGMRVMLDEEARNNTTKERDAAQAVLVELYNALKERRLVSPLQSIRVADEMAPLESGVREMNHVSRTAAIAPHDLAPEDRVSPTDVVAVVACHHRERPALRMQEWLVLGSQPLSALRDRLSGFCLADHANDGPNVRSAFFFIENTFYNDMREPDNLDYSRPIIDWAQHPDRVHQQPGFAQYRAADIDAVLVRDLAVRVGQPYAYVHQGDCEHVIIFKDVRLVHASDPQDAREYPVRTFQSRIRKRLCRFCKERQANKVTYGDRLSGENPAFFCEPCYVMYHYDKDNRLLYSDFKVYDYHHD
eukprot:Unigene14972_Nuclearia_a/m.44920 Unigene14972_Nuclearia_a/g.44920  ORF Unigene14972_Nuclearia_a/g.44920 Unigene14972_Nuclearia_a/m.44920 type:complete len:305 (-) Unigene14972_Nuclearia_a:94-1008(-)